MALVGGIRLCTIPILTFTRNLFCYIVPETPAKVIPVALSYTRTQVQVPLNWLDSCRGALVVLLILVSILASHTSLAGLRPTLSKQE